MTIFGCIFNLNILVSKILFLSYDFVSVGVGQVTTFMAGSYL